MTCELVWVKGRESLKSKRFCFKMLMDDWIGPFQNEIKIVPLEYLDSIHNERAF